MAEINSLPSTFELDMEARSETGQHFFTDVTKSVVLTETGAAREPGRVDAMLKNLRSVLLTPVHG